MVWFGLYSTNLNGPVPIGAWRISRGETWQGYIGEKPEASRPSNAGCGAFSLKMASLSPFTVTLSTLAYQPLRKLTLKFSGALPCRRSMVHFTSAALNGLPSCHLMPWRRVKVRVLPSSLHVHFSARSGTMSSRLFCFLAGSNMTRLLKTPIIGSTTEMVPSSWIDMLEGLSRWVMRRMPPCFCAEALPKGAMSKNARTTKRTDDNATRTIIGFLHSRGLHSLDGILRIGGHIGPRSLYAGRTLRCRNRLRGDLRRYDAEGPRRSRGLPQRAMD